MPKRNRHRSRTMKGGFLDDFSNTLSGWGSSISQGASSMWQKTKSTLSGTPSSSYIPPPPTPSYTPPSPPSPPSQPSQPSPPSYSSESQMNKYRYGGKYSRRRRHKRGGGVAHNASPVSGEKTAQPHNWVGGRTRKRNKKGGKTRRMRKH